MLYIILFIIFVLLIFYKYWTYNDYYWTKRNVLQINGVIQRFIFEKGSLSEIYKNLCDKFPNEKYIGIFLSKPAVIVRDPQDVQAVLQGDFQNFHSRGIFTNPEDILTKSILFSNDYNHCRLVRNKISPIFSIAKLKNMFHTIDMCARDFMQIEDILKYMENDSFNALSILTSSCIAATIFGAQSKSENAIKSPFLDIVRTTTSFLFNLKFTMLNFSPFLFKFLKLKMFGQQEEFFISTFKKVIENRRHSDELRDDYIDTCIKLQRNGIMKDRKTGFEMEPTDEILAAQAFVFFIAGVDSSATTMHFILLELASHPEVLSRLHLEIDKVFDNCGGTLTYEIIENMQYLEMVVNESMRKYPLVGAMQRQCTYNTILPYGNLEINKDEIVVVPTFAFHRDNKIFPNSNLFNPERFAPENIGNIKKFTYLPFGEGHRLCIGNRFGRNLVKTGIVHLLRTFTLKEQRYKPKTFDKSPIGIKDTKAKIKFIYRDKERN